MASNLLMNCVISAQCGQQPRALSSALTRIAFAFVAHEDEDEGSVGHALHYVDLWRT